MPRHRSAGRPRRVRPPASLNAPIDIRRRFRSPARSRGVNEEAQTAAITQSRPMARQREETAPASRRPPRLRPPAHGIFAGSEATDSHHGPAAILLSDRQAADVDAHAGGVAHFAGRTCVQQFFRKIQHDRRGRRGDGRADARLRAVELGERECGEDAATTHASEMNVHMAMSWRVAEPGDCRRAACEKRAALSRAQDFIENQMQLRLHANALAARAVDGDNRLDAELPGLSPRRLPG